MRPLTLALALPFLSLAGCAVGLGIPPMRVDVGPSILVPGSGQAAAGNFHTTVGVHLASADVNPEFPVDVGVGYSLETVHRDGTPLTARVPVHGVYVEANAALPFGKTPWSRAWIGPRIDLLLADDAHVARAGIGIVGRFSWEAFKVTKAQVSGHSSKILESHGYAAYGTAAIGFYVEAGYQWLPFGDGAAVLSAGLTLRLPMFGAGTAFVPLPF